MISFFFNMCILPYLTIFRDTKDHLSSLVAPWKYPPPSQARPVRNAFLSVASLAKECQIICSFGKRGKCFQSFGSSVNFYIIINFCLWIQLFILDIFLQNIFKLQMYWNTSTLVLLTDSSVPIMLLYPIWSLSPGFGLVSFNPKFLIGLAYSD